MSPTINSNGILESYYWKKCINVLKNPWGIVIILPQLICAGERSANLSEKGYKPMRRRVSLC